jgi:hypothetical protein
MDDRKIEDTREDRVQVASIVGEVKDRNTKKPISGVKVQILELPEKNEVKTDEVGLYCFSNLRTPGKYTITPGKYTIKVDASGYEQKERSISLTRAHMQDSKTYKGPFTCNFELGNKRKGGAMNG